MQVAGGGGRKRRRGVGSRETSWALLDHYPKFNVEMQLANALALYLSCMGRVLILCFIALHFTLSVDIDGRHIKKSDVTSATIFLQQEKTCRWKFV